MMLKRVFDFTFSGVCLIGCAPLILIIAAANWAESRAVFYRQRVAGRGGKPFTMLRFRTMGDHRESRVGQMIRNLSLDHLPTLIHVLRGEMSIIGPRPELIECIDLTNADWRAILSVRPGLVSPAVLALARTYNQSPQSVRNQLELEYVRQQSMTHDLRLLAQAFRALIVSKGNIKAHGKPQK